MKFRNSIVQKWWYMKQIPERWLIGFKWKWISVDKCNYFVPGWFVLIWSYLQIKEAREVICAPWFITACTCGPFVLFLSTSACIANMSLINSGRYWFAGPFEDKLWVKTPMNNKCEILWLISSTLLLYESYKSSILFSLRAWSYNEWQENNAISLLQYT